jgi:hypothetical protein
MVVDLTLRHKNSFHALTPNAVNRLSGRRAVIAEIALTAQAVAGAVFQITLLPVFALIFT